MNNTELKPCPFCGERNIEVVKGHTALHIILCKGCGATVSFYEKTDKLEASEAWNRRAANDTARAV